MTKKSILRDWVMELPMMQQTTLITALRGHDGFTKHHPIKDIMRMYRRSILNMPMDNKETDDPLEQVGGNFNGPIHCGSVPQATENFILALDEMSLHFFTHMLHGIEILGYTHPDHAVRGFWLGLYQRMCRKIHVEPEHRLDMEDRLSDSLESWLDKVDDSEKIKKENES